MGCGGNVASSSFKKSSFLVMLSLITPRQATAQDAEMLRARGPYCDLILSSVYSPSIFPALSELRCLAACRILNNPLTLPLKLNPGANRIFQSFR
jgi:hypothetical protein